MLLKPVICALWTFIFCPFLFLLSLATPVVRSFAFSLHLKLFLCIKAFWMIYLRLTIAFILVLISLSDFYEKKIIIWVFFWQQSLLVFNIWYWYSLFDKFDHNIFFIKSVFEYFFDQNTYMQYEDIKKQMQKYSKSYQTIC